MHFRWSFIFSTYGLYFLPGSNFAPFEEVKVPVSQKKCPLEDFGGFGVVRVLKYRSAWQRQLRQLPPCPWSLPWCPLKCSNRKLQIPYRGALYQRITALPLQVWSICLRCYNLSMINQFNILTSREFWLSENSMLEWTHKILMCVHLFLVNNISKFKSMYMYTVHLYINFIFIVIVQLKWTRK